MEGRSAAGKALKSALKLATKRAKPLKPASKREKALKPALRPATKRERR